MITTKTYNELWEWAEESERVSEDYILPGTDVNIHLADYPELLHDGTVEVLYRFSNNHMDFQDVNKNTYKTYNGAIRWLAKNGYVKVA